MRKWQIVLYGWVGSQSPRRARLGCRAQLTITRGAEKQQWDWVKGITNQEAKPFPENRFCSLSTCCTWQGPFCASAGHSALSACFLCCDYQHLPGLPHCSGASGDSLTEGQWQHGQCDTLLCCLPPQALSASYIKTSEPTVTFSIL